MSRVININVDRGVDFDAVFILQYANGVVRDLTGYTASSIIRKHADGIVIAEFNTTVGDDEGWVALHMQPAVSMGIEPGRYIYDIKITSPSNSVYRIVEGTVFFNS